MGLAKQFWLGPPKDAVPKGLLDLYIGVTEFMGGSVVLDLVLGWVIWG
jgi:hypothetical protein